MCVTELDLSFAIKCMQSKILVKKKEEKLTIMLSFGLHILVNVASFQGDSYFADPNTAEIQFKK